MKERAASPLLRALLAAAALAGAPAGALEVQMYVITDWVDECSGADRSTWDDMVRQWYDTMGALGHAKDRSWVNGEFDRDLLCDPDTGLDNCRDHLYADEGDAVMLGLHGSDRGKHWRGRLRRDGGVDDCWIDAPESAGDGELLLGDIDAEFLHLSSCNSLDDDNLPFAWRMFQDPKDSPGSGARLHQVTGFHGMMGVGPSYVFDYWAFALNAHFVSIKDSWMDAMYHHDGNTKCPVAYAVGSSENDCWSRLDGERYDNVFGDPGAVTHYCYAYYEDCHPAQEDAFVPPE